MSDKAPFYQVLARKYRPARFDDLIGQEPMVRTLRNAFAAGRIPHAWMLTGVRGVGKTTTARILARGLNHESEDGGGGPNVDLAAEGVHCRAIMEGRHPDVIEMDAASHTGIDDIRDIIDSARYSPVSARFKVYIIDEVHMLSKQAFNGLLKTLEEPPAHVKFVFATTEIRKVPVTVLSRCQRFDLRRVEVAVLMQHLAGIAEQEAVAADAGALRQIARAAEGSVRDALSIFDQAIAHGAGTVSGEVVQAMLGLADRTRIVDLFEQVMRGDIAAALAELEALHKTGADPAVVLTDLAEFTHYVTRFKLAPAAAAQALSETERVRGAALAATLSVRILARTWQMLVKGIAEVSEAPRPLVAADMVLVRLCHAADLPTPDEAIRMVADGGAEVAAPALQAPRPTSSGGQARQAFGAARRREAEPETTPLAATAPELRRFEEVVARARAERDIALASALERCVRPIRFEPGRIEIALTEDADPGLPQRLGIVLQKWTGRRWIVAVSRDNVATETAREARQRSRAALIEEVRADPLVKKLLERFPGAEITDIRTRGPAAEPGGPAAAAPAAIPIQISKDQPT